MIDDIEIFVDRNKKYLKGNLHTHTTVSDGDYTIREVLNIYKDNGYDFLGITDHEIFCDSNEDAGITLVHGIEEASSYVGNDDRAGTYAHFNCFLPKDNGEVKAYYYQNILDLQGTLDELKNKYELVQFNHPLFSRFLDNEHLALDGYDLIEIYNHKDFVEETGMSNAENLIRTMLNNHKKFWISANDDFHGPYYGTKNDRCFGGFNMVCADNNEESILHAIKNGCFYPTTGPMIKDFRREGNIFKIETTPVKRIIFYSNMRRCKNIYDLNDEEITYGEYELRGNEFYLWVKIIDKDGKLAWSQPVYLE